MVNTSQSAVCGIHAGAAAASSIAAEVHSLLEAHGIDTSSWGKAATKGVERLIHEIASGEASLQYHGSRLARVISVTRVDVRYEHPNLGPLKLVEDRQVFNDGSSRVRANPFSLWEKMYVGESFSETVPRVLKEELKVTGPAASVSLTARGQKDEAPQDYPGLWTRYVHEDYHVQLAPEQFNLSGYQDVQDDKTTYFTWRSARSSDAEGRKALLFGLDNDPAQPESNDKRIERYIQCLHNRVAVAEKEAPAITAGLCGRVLRGKGDHDFCTLSSDPRRKLILLLDDRGLAQLLGKSGRDICSTVLGYTAAHIADKFGIDPDGTRRNEIRVAVFPAGQGVKLATWEQVIEVVIQQYPHFKDPLLAALPSLISPTYRFTDYERMYGACMQTVEEAGPSHPKFMTEERFAASAQTASDVRAFLYFSVHLRENFTGTGYLKMDDGSRGPKEYIAANVPLNELGEYSLVRVPF